MTHGTCIAREGEGVLLVGPPGIGKSDLALRLFDRGFILVADDQVNLMPSSCGWVASAFEKNAGMIEIRGLGIVRVAYALSARLVLAVQLQSGVERLPSPARLPDVDIPMFYLDPRSISAPILVEWALDIVQGRREMVAGAFL